MHQGAASTQGCCCIFRSHKYCMWLSQKPCNTCQTLRRVQWDNAVIICSSHHRIQASPDKAQIQFKMIRKSLNSSFDSLHSAQISTV